MMGLAYDSPRFVFYERGLPPANKNSRFIVIVFGFLRFTILVVSWTEIRELPETPDKFLV